METEEIDLLFKESELIEGENKLEDSPILSTLLKPISHDYVSNETLFVVVKTYKDELVKDFPNLSLCGKSVLDWVLLAGCGCEKQVIEDENVFDKIRNIQTDKKVIAVFYCDTPLLDRNTFFKIMDYFSSRGINYLQLSRGFIVKTDYLKNNPDFQPNFIGEFDDKNLLIVDSSQALNLVHKLLQDKIRLFHMNNGVVIMGDQSIFIDCDVEIESGVIIYPNNTIKGNSVIAQGVILEEGNLIVDSIISEGAVLSNCYIEESKVSGELRNQSISNQEI